MKFNPNIMQLEKWKFLQYHPVYKWTQKYAQHIGLWWVVHKHCQTVQGGDRDRAKEVGTMHIL